eukprot:6304323-Pyramimonas_sp.AAC.1
MQFDTLQKPFRVKFWRQSNVTMCRYRNPFDLCRMPLGSAECGCGLVALPQPRSISVFHQLLVHWLMSENIIEVAGATAEERRSGTVQRFKAILFEWYSSVERRGCPRHRAQNIAQGMFGETEGGLVSLHGAEGSDILMVQGFGGTTLRDACAHAAQLRGMEQRHGPG